MTTPRTITAAMIIAELIIAIGMIQVVIGHFSLLAISSLS